MYPGIHLDGAGGARQTNPFACDTREGVRSLPIIGQIRRDEVFTIIQRPGQAFESLLLSLPQEQILRTTN
jgi:hypothetical protein